MVWGFPLSLKSKKSGQPLKPKPVNNARTDKLSQFFWRDSFEKRRCLIPLTAWAEAEGPRGSMTRTWLSLPDAELFAVAGVWRSSDEWGDCYSMVMKDGTGAAAEVQALLQTWGTAARRHPVGGLGSIGEMLIEHNHGFGQGRGSNSECSFNQAHLPHDTWLQAPCLGLSFA